MNLEEEYERIKENHRQAIIVRVARVCFSSSTGRVFPRAKRKEEISASAKIREVLTGINVDDLLTIESEEQFKAWFEKNLTLVTQVIPDENSHGEELSDGTRRWGYAAKILTLFLRDIVEHCRYFSDDQAKRARKWLYTPMDSEVMDKLCECGEQIPFGKIKEIDTREKFYGVQDLLGRAANKVGIPRVWFDDNWGDRNDKAKRKNTQ